RPRTGGLRAGNLRRRALGAVQRRRGAAPDLHSHRPGPARGEEMTRSRIIEIVAVSLGTCFVLACMGVLAPFDVIAQIVFCWALFLVRVLPRMRIDWAGTLTALICLAGLCAGLHLFLRWLYSQVRRVEGEMPPPWRLRWTVMILSLVVLLFVTGISAVGIT